MTCSDTDDLKKVDVHPNIRRLPSYFDEVLPTVSALSEYRNQS